MGKLGKSNLAGKCSAGKHDIAVGQENYYEKINDKWIRCSDLDCFKAQGGSYDPNVKSYPQKKIRTIEERMTESKQMVEFCWNLANKTATGVEDKKDRLILAQVLFKGLVKDWVR